MNRNHVDAQNNLLQVMAFYVIHAGRLQSPELRSSYARFRTAIINPPQGLHLNHNDLQRATHMVDHHQIHFTQTIVQSAT
jgi:predicted RNA methylase